MILKNYCKYVFLPPYPSQLNAIELVLEELNLN